MPYHPKEDGCTLAAHPEVVYSSYILPFVRHKHLNSISSDYGLSHGRKPEQTASLLSVIIC